LTATVGNAVATPHHLSAEAGRHVLASGGNAVDAAIAAVATQGVVAPETSGIGGDLFALIHRPGWDAPRALNASGHAGSNANSKTLRDAGEIEVPREHPLTVTIPGCIDGFAALSSELGELPLSDALEPAIASAMSGFEVSTEQASAFGRMASVYRDNPAISDFYPEGRPVVRGDLVKRRDLATILESVANEGRDGFYLGQAGEDIVEAVGGLITGSDLGRDQAEWVDPIGVEVGGLESWTIPPNSQGYLGPGTLAVFEMLDPPGDLTDPMRLHLLIEAYRSLAWERNDLVADPGLLALPADLLLDADRLARAATSVSRTQAGTWPRGIGRASGTSYLCVADADGMAVSIIQSNYRGTGSPFGAARSGFLLQDRGGGFSLTPGHPNELGPGKRPLHTLSPTLWTDGLNPRWLLGTRGGAVQPQLVAQVGAAAILGGAGLEFAQASPRWTVADFGPHSEPTLLVEPGFAAETLIELRRRGHIITELETLQPSWGPLSVIELDDDTRRSAPDPRVETTTALLF
jgi:gamma-glutamyltranspeptidase/glutathione hydrolase